MMSALILVMIFLALLAANLPWLSEKFMIFFEPPAAQKLEWMRWLEWFVLYLFIYLIAMGLENYATGERHTQGWEFITVTLCLFLVSSTPSFLYRHHLLKAYSK